MSDPGKDLDGVDRPDETTDVHRNTRSSAAGVEERPATNTGAEPSPGLIGNGQGVDPRYVAQR